MIRKDIQGLRAIAVVAVLLFHFWPEHLTGGYVGVDIFFVISGFLITSHLIRKPPVSRQMLFEFWARRIKRLIPAATLVLLVTVLASVLWLPNTMLQSTMYEAAAAAVYGVNWLFAINATDYLAATNATSPIQHYWSLSIEEQYYAVWPLIVGLVFILGRRIYGSRRMLAIALGLIFTASLAYSIYYTAANPAAAYFVTTTRIWELTLGGIVALIVLKFTLPDKIAAPAAWLGLIAIATAAITYTKETAFPGYTALMPTLGTALVIWAYSDNVKWSPRWLLSLRPAQIMGDISYSVYLWHWPIVVIAPYALGAEYLLLWQKIILIILTIGLSMLSKKYVEDFFRQERPFFNTNPRVFGYGVTSIAAVVVVSFSVATWVGNAEVRAAEKLDKALNSKVGCFGVQAMKDSDCPNIGEEMYMTPATARKDRSVLYKDNCWSNKPFDEAPVCEYGEKDSDAKIALLGNSHGGMWHAAVEETAIRNGWGLDTYLISECYTVFAPIAFSGQGVTEACNKWNKWAVNTIIEKEYEAVVISNRTYAKLKDVRDVDQLKMQQSEYEKILKIFSDAGVKVLAIRDGPEGKGNVPDCLARYEDDIMQCAGIRDEVLKEDPLYYAASSVNRSNVKALDLSNLFCDDKYCYPVIGGVITYFDHGHLTNTLVKTLSTDIEEPFLELINSQQ